MRVLRVLLVVLGVKHIVSGCVAPKRIVKSSILERRVEMKKRVFSMMVMVLALAGVGSAAELAVGNPNASNGWSSLSAIVSATSSGYMYTLPPSCAVDGSGLDAETGTMMDTNIWNLLWIGPPNGGVMDPHAGTVNPCLNWIAFEFDKVYPLTLVHIWNYNRSPVDPLCGAGARNITVQYSLTGGPNASEWQTLGTFEARKGTGEPNFTGNDLCNFMGSQVKYVCFSIMTDWNTPYGDQGISEFRFFYTDDPCNYVPPSTRQLTVQTSPSFVTTTVPLAGTWAMIAGNQAVISASRYVNCPDIYFFSHWEGEGITDPNSANTSVLMDTDRTVTAVYVKNNQCGDDCHPYATVHDVTKDCKVDFSDFASFALDWMKCTKVEGCP
jgi:hypothetical protein